ncbi:hypothetical protein GCM10007860_14700 [Chitiniphilus shinanonensis]|uniref:Uncharacterized protein n=1 Tax=Chitiniphilus shinanonensis TaxID=553088 RepID=A0ABQ6BWN6_9NEIS|nr:hypothetical protein GCM10007860_14700 [Chitiniphilus shinanonensis]
MQVVLIDDLAVAEYGGGGEGGSLFTNEDSHGDLLCVCRDETEKRIAPRRRAARAGGTVRPVMGRRSNDSRSLLTRQIRKVDMADSYFLSQRQPLSRSRGDAIIVMLDTEDN